MFKNLSYGGGVGYSKTNFIIGKIIDEEEVFRSEGPLEVEKRIELNENLPYIEVYDYSDCNGFYNLNVSLNLREKSFSIISNCFNSYKPEHEIEEELLDSLYEDYNIKHEIVENLGKYDSYDTINALRYIFSTDLKFEASKEDIFEGFKELYDSSNDCANYFLNNGIFPSKNNETMVDLFEVLMKEFDIPEDTFLYVENDEIFAKYVYEDTFIGEKKEDPISILKIDKSNLWNLEKVNLKNIEELQEIEKSEKKYGNFNENESFVLE